jgi:hypothetical protein
MGMNEQEITQLVDEIDNADPEQLWWDSELFNRAARVRDVRVVRALALCHHSLSNKEAFSAHVVRNALKTIDAPDFALSWSIIDAEKDAGQLIQRLEDFYYAPWAVAFVLGEIGGAGALRGAAARLGQEHAARHYMIVRIISHILIRYLKIQSPKPATMTMIDLKTGEMTRGIPVEEGSQQQQMETRRRVEADELFTPLDPALAQSIKTRLAGIPDKLLNCSRDQFDALLDRVPKRYA